MIVVIYSEIESSMLGQLRFTELNRRDAEEYLI